MSAHTQDGKAPDYTVFDRPENVRRILAGFFVACVALFVADFFVDRHESFPEDHAFPIELWPGFYCVYGLVACVVLVIIAKEMRKVVMRPEDYYDDQ